MGSAALVLDGPGGERVLRAGLEALEATTRIYPKTLSVRPVFLTPVFALMRFWLACPKWPHTAQ